MENNILENVNKLYRSVKKFILCGVDEDGFPTAKAVLPSKGRDTINEMFFVTNTASKYVEQIKSGSKTSVYFFDPIFYRGCLLKGAMTICEDMDIKRKLWKNSYQCAYPQGRELKYQDPDFCVLKFVSASGRYYAMFQKHDFVL